LIAKGNFKATTPTRLQP